MELVSYSDNFFLNYGVAELLRFKVGSERKYTLGNVVLDTLLIFNDLDISQTIERVLSDAARFAGQNVMVLTESVSPLIVGYLLRKARGLVVYNTRKNHCEVLIDVNCSETYAGKEQEHYFPFSDNQLFIILSLSLGVRPETVAKITGRSKKRISAIKRDVMNRLNIKNSKVFYKVVSAIFLHKNNAEIAHPMALTRSL